MTQARGFLPGRFHRRERRSRSARPSAASSGRTAACRSSSAGSSSARSQCAEMAMAVERRSRWRVRSGPSSTGACTFSVATPALRPRVSRSDAAAPPSTRRWERARRCQASVRHRRRPRKVIRIPRSPWKTAGPWNAGLRVRLRRPFAPAASTRSAPTFRSAPVGPRAGGSDQGPGRVLRNHRVLRLAETKRYKIHVRVLQRATARTRSAGVPGARLRRRPSRPVPRQDHCRSD